MRIVIALGGNALLRRGEPLTAEAQRANIRSAADSISGIAAGNELIITHGNGPQVGLLALQAAAHKPEEMVPLDVLGAESEGMIGYMIEQELRNRLPSERSIATLLTMVEVDPSDPAFDAPTKFIGPVYSETDARRLAAENGWSIRPDGDAWRRVVPSPLPKRIFQTRPVQHLLEIDAVVICSGGGGIPTMYNADRQLVGAEAVIDKDLSSELLSRQLEADIFIMATDINAIYTDWESERRHAIRASNPQSIRQYQFPAGSMGPKVDAACQFTRATGNKAIIGALADLADIVNGTAGTTIRSDVDGMSFYQ